MIFYALLRYFQIFFEFHPKVVLALAITTDMISLVSGSQNFTVRIFNIQNMQKESILRRGHYFANALSITSGREYITSEYSDNTNHMKLPKITMETIL